MNKQIDRTKSNLKIKERKKRNLKISEIKSNRIKRKNNLISNAQIIFGLDNGSTGTISCINKNTNKISFQKTPSRIELDYTQDIKYINRINVSDLKQWFINNTISADLNSVLVVLERPMKNPMRFEQSIAACRAFEATLIVIEELKFEYIVIDSKQWQHYFFGKNTSNIDLKFESMKKGLEVLNTYFNLQENYNEISNLIKDHGDADSLLISQYIVEKSLTKGN